MSRKRRQQRQQETEPQPAEPTPRPSPRRRTTARQKVLLVVFGLALFALLLVIVEGALVLFDIGRPQLYEDPFVGFAPGRDLFVEKTLPSGERVYAVPEAKLAFFNEQQFPVDKDEDTYRIFTLGGSTTAGRPYDADVAFARWLELYLDAVDTSRNWQVINAGAISYASYRVVLLMRELVDYEPDLFVVYTGHNEFLEERTYADIIHENPTKKRLRLWLNSRRFYVLARQAARQLTSEPKDVPTTLDSEVTTQLDGWTGLGRFHRDDELERSVVDHFDYNLRQMVAIARASGAGIVFVTPVSNLRDFSPFKSEHSRALAATDLARFDSLLERGRQAVVADDGQGALPLLTEAETLDPEYPALEFEIGRAHFLLGDEASARRAFIEAKDLDAAPLRALEAIVDHVEQVARETGVPLIDLPTLLEQENRAAYGHGLLGNEVFLDHVHPDIPVHSRIALEVLRLLQDEGVVREQQPLATARQQEIYHQVIDSLDPSYYAQRDLNLAKVLGWAGKLAEAEPPLLRAATLLDDNADLHLNLGILYQKTARPQLAVPQLERALELGADPALTEFNLGVAYGMTGNLAAGIDALESAVSLEATAEATFNLGVLYRRQGNLDRAEESLRTSLEKKPGAPETQRQLGIVYRLQGKGELAVATFEQILELRPNDSDTLAELGITLGELGQLDEARSRLDEALSIDPNDATLHYNLGIVLGQMNQQAEAMASYEKALELEPRYAAVYNNIGILDARNGNLPAAAAALEQAVAIEPTYSEALFNLGIVYENGGRLHDALGVMKRALELEPENPRIHFGLGALYFSLGNLQQARQHFDRAAAAGLAPPPEIRTRLEASSG